MYRMSRVAEVVAAVVVVSLSNRNKMRRVAKLNLERWEDGGCGEDWTVGLALTLALSSGQSECTRYGDD